MLKSKTWRFIFQAIIWLIVFLFPLFSYNVKVLDPHFYLKECINNALLVALFYFHMNFLIPRYFVRNKILVYLCFILASVTVVAAAQHLVEYSTFKKIATVRRQPVIVAMRSHLTGDSLVAETLRTVPRIGVPGPPAPWQFGRPGTFRHERQILHLPSFIFFMTLRKSFLSALLILLASGFIRTALELFKTEREKSELEKEKLNAELVFLKSQVNPHFLFNSLNSIYSLAHRRAKETETAILQLSQMMRYMIYESNTSQVLLEKELEYLENYIHLRKLRLAPNIHIHYNVKGNIDGLYIEPMLLIPFIENAFKHGISYAEQCDITIEITLTGQHELHLLVSNKIFQKENKPEVGGIGLENVKKRLQLLYPGQHELQIEKSNDYYITTLYILLKNSAYA